jgi:hypothetical protein
VGGVWIVNVLRAYHGSISQVGGKEGGRVVRGEVGRVYPQHIAHSTHLADPAFSAIYLQTSTFTGGLVSLGRYLGRQSR